MNVAIMNQKAEVRQKPLAVRSVRLDGIGSEIKFQRSEKSHFLSFPRKRESSLYGFLDSRLRGSDALAAG
jgi:hypothetical protein